MNYPSATAIKAIKLGKTVVGPEGKLVILNNINLEINRGETVAITGASGSGKTSLISLLAGLDNPTEGQVYLLGQEITLINEDGRANLRRGRVGFVFQSFQLIPQLTALENTLLPLELEVQENEGAGSKQQRALEALSDVGLQHRLHHFPRSLSGGEQQRVALARAFITHPDVLFADEPTGNLDEKTGEQVIDLLMNLNNHHKTTLVLVTHNEQLAQHCDHNLKLSQGKIAQ